MNHKPTLNSMEAVLDQLGRRCAGEAAGFVIYEIAWARFAPLCCQWSRNRAPDPARVAAIVAHARGGGYVPPLLHFAELPARYCLRRRRQRRKRRKRRRRRSPTWSECWPS